MGGCVLACGNAMALSFVWTELIALLFFEFLFLVLLCIKATRLKKWEFELKAEEAALVSKQARLNKKTT